MVKKILGHRDSDDLEPMRRTRLCHHSPTHATCFMGVRVELIDNLENRKKTKKYKLMANSVGFHPE